MIMGVRLGRLEQKNVLLDLIAINYMDYMTSSIDISPVIILIFISSDLLINNKEESRLSIERFIFLSVVESGLSPLSVVRVR